MIPSYLLLEQFNRGLIEVLSAEDLRRLLKEQFHIRLEHLTSPQRPFRLQVVDVIETVNRAGWLQDLIEAVYRLNPGHPAMAKLYGALGLMPSVSVQQAGVSTTPSPTKQLSGFERVGRGPLPILDLDVWTVEATRVADRVCRIETVQEAMATGFLVGPDAVLTAYHVLERQLDGSLPPSQVQFRFEFRVLADGTRSDGVVVGLHATDWLIDCAPYAPGEKAQDPTTPPTPDELGHVLVRLARPIGLEPPGRGRGGPPRGWIWVPDRPPVLATKSPVIIAHYLSGGPLKLSVDTQGMIGPNENGTRIRYQVETGPGSSGSPCFDIGWTLFAVHQYAHRPPSEAPAFRHGIPTFAIRNRLEGLGKADTLGGPN
jgi:hypothetical protein